MEIAVVLHNIRSSYNVGSVFRTADAAGVQNIYLTGITPSPFDVHGQLRKDFAKVSLGSEKHLAWQRVSSAKVLIKKLKKQGFLIFALEQSKISLPYYKVKPKEKDKIAIVLGSEVKGLPLSILREADKVLEIPMLGKKESLNVAVAFGVVAFSLIFSHH